jgi:hypothetical protein
MGANGGPPDRAHIVHHRMDEMLVSKTPFLMERPLLLFRKGPNTPRICVLSFFT